MAVTGGVFGANPFANPFDTSGFDMTQSAFNPGQFVPFGDVYRQMTAAAPWTLNPLGRRAAASMQPLLSTQYALQQPGVNMPESMVGQNPYRQFLPGNLYGMTPRHQAVGLPHRCRDKTYRLGLNVSLTW